MDVDATQVLDLGYDDEDNSVSVKKEVGFLKTMKHKKFPETEFPVYEGTNIIGRDDRSQIIIKVQALSKKHACIEVAGEICLVYDFDSRNKSKKGTLVLKPLVRYELKDGDELTFADVSCKFALKQDEELDETSSLTASETGSESMITEEEEEKLKASKEELAACMQGEGSKEELSVKDQDVGKDNGLLDSGEEFSLHLTEEAPDDNAKRNEGLNISNDSILLPTQNNVDPTDSFDDDMQAVSTKLMNVDDPYAAETESESDGEHTNAPSGEAVTIVGQSPGFNLSQRTTSSITGQIPESPNLSVATVTNNKVSLESPAKLVTFGTPDQQKIEASLKLDNSIKTDYLMNNDEKQAIDIRQIALDSPPTVLENDNLSCSYETDPDQYASTLPIVSSQETSKNKENRKDSEDGKLDHENESHAADPDQLCDTFPTDMQDQVDQDDAAEDICSTYIFEERDYEGEDEEEEGNGQENKINKVNTSETFMEEGSQEIPFSAVCKFKTSTQLLDSFQSFGTPASSIENDSNSRKSSSEEKKDCNKQEKMVISDSDEEATQPYETYSPFKSTSTIPKDEFKIPQVPTEKKASTLPGGSVSEDFYEVADAATHMSSSDDDAPDNVYTNGINSIENTDVVGLYDGETQPYTDEDKVSDGDGDMEIDGPTQAYCGADNVDGPTQAYILENMEEKNENLGKPIHMYFDDVNIATQVYDGNEAKGVDNIDGPTQAYTIGESRNVDSDSSRDDDEDDDHKKVDGSASVVQKDDDDIQDEKKEEIYTEIMEGKEKVSKKSSRTRRDQRKVPTQNSNLQDTGDKVTNITLPESNKRPIRKTRITKSVQFILEQDAKEREEQQMLKKGKRKRSDTNTESIDIEKLDSKSKSNKKVKNISKGESPQNASEIPENTVKEDFHKQTTARGRKVSVRLKRNKIKETSPSVVELLQENTNDQFCDGKTDTVENVCDINTDAKPSRTQRIEELRNRYNEIKEEEPKRLRAVRSKSKTSVTDIEDNEETPADTGLEPSLEVQISSSRSRSKRKTVIEKTAVESDKKKGKSKRKDSIKTEIQNSQYQIIFTGISDKTVEKIVTDLGGEIVDDVASATHLVTDKVRRTVKFLCAVARGIPIVSPEWLKSAKSANTITSHKSHLVDDQAAERQYKFVLKRSIEKASEAPLLKDYRIYVTKNVKPEPRSMKEMIESSGGKFLVKAPRSQSDDVIIISCAEDVKEHGKLARQGFCVCNNELLLTGILRQELELDQFSI